MWDTAKISLQAEVRISAGVNFRKWSDFFPFFLVAVVSGGGGVLHWTSTFLIPAWIASFMQVLKRT